MEPLRIVHAAVPNFNDAKMDVGNARNTRLFSGMVKTTFLSEHQHTSGQGATCTVYTKYTVVFSDFVFGCTKTRVRSNAKDILVHTEGSMPVGLVDAVGKGNNKGIM